MFTNLKLFVLTQTIFLFFTSLCFADTIESYDFMGNLTVTYYNTHKQIESVESYTKTQDNNLQIVSIERFEWHPLFMNSLIERTLEDSHGNLLISQTSFYNDQEQLIEEHFQNYLEEPISIHHSYVYCEDGSRIKTITIENNSTTPLPFSINYNASDCFNEALPSFNPTFEQSISEEKEFFSRMSGQYLDPAESATFHGREVHDKVRVSFVNGILNIKTDFLKTVQWISDIHGGVNIHYTFKPTEGWAWDLLKSSWAKLGIISPEAYSIAKTWKQLIAEMGGTEGGGTIIHYAHSIGGTNTYIAKSLMTSDELKMIQVFTFGSPTIIPSEDFQSVRNYISIRDGVPLIFDFIELIKVLFYDDTHICYVGTHWGIPFADHLLEYDSYRIPLENYGKAFVEQYCNN